MADPRPLNNRTLTSPNGHKWEIVGLEPPAEYVMVAEGYRVGDGGQANIEIATAEIESLIEFGGYRLEG